VFYKNEKPTERVKTEFLILESSNISVRPKLYLPSTRRPKGRSYPTPIIPEISEVSASTISSYKSLIESSTKIPN